jgi:hypothetical protein
MNDQSRPAISPGNSAVPPTRGLRRGDYRFGGPGGKGYTVFATGFEADQPQIAARYDCGVAKHIQDRVSDWTLAIWVIVVIAALVINYLRGH